VSANLSRWFGIDGTNALFARALVRAQTDHPALANVRYRMSALDLFAGIDRLGKQRLVRDWWSSNGMGSIASMLRGLRADAAVCCEPTELNTLIACRGGSLL